MNTLFTLIQALFSAPNKSDAQKFNSSFAMSPISSIIYAQTCAKQDNTAKQENFFDPAYQQLPKGFVADSNFHMGFAMSFISGVLSSALKEQSKAKAPQSTALKAAPRATKENNDISYMAGMSPISAVYSATLESSVNAKQAPRATKENNDISYMAGMSPISAVYSATLESSVNAKQAPRAIKENNDISYMAGMSPISAVYSATLESSVNAKQAPRAIKENNDISYMAGMSPISAVYSATVAEQNRAVNGERQPKSFAIENDGFAMSPAMSLVSGVFCSALNEMLKSKNQEANVTPATKSTDSYTMATTTPVSAIYMAMRQTMATPATEDQNTLETQSVANDELFFAGNIYAAATSEYLKAKQALKHASASQRELINSYQQAYAKRGYDPVQSLIMASVSAARDCSNNANDPLFDAATEERVAQRWDSIWNQMSLDSSAINKQTAANEASPITFKAPFERYYNSKGQLINNKLNKAA